MVFVTNETIRRTKEVFGRFYKYTYLNNDIECQVYCKSDNDFLELLLSWNAQSRRMGMPYLYGPLRKEHIDLGAIPSDGKGLKILLTCPYTNVSYIQ